METGEVLDASILIEGKHGLTTVYGVIEHPPAIHNCLVLWPEKADYDRALDLAWKLRLRGTPVGCTDLLIAAMCLNRDLTLVTKDKDFQQIQAIAPELKISIRASSRYF
jgi:hypothetical protein